MSKHEEKLHAKIQMKLMNLQTAYNIFETPPAFEATLEDMLAYLHQLKEEQNVSFVNGKGRRKSKLQKDIEELEQYKRKLEEYDVSKKILKERCSDSKTDHDATFMRMKEDYMKNGQLKPGYNLQIGVSGEFAVTAGIFNERSDMLTLLALIQRMKEKLHRVPKRVITDADMKVQTLDLRARKTTKDSKR